MKIIFYLRYSLLIFFIMLLGNNSISQEYFRQGIEYYEKGEYYLADSFLTLYLNKYPMDRNARFNRAVAKLYLNETCSFCNELYVLNNPLEQDQQALQLYFEHCGKTDTVFYDKKWIVSDRSNYRFYEVREYHKCRDAITVKIHDKKLKKELHVINLFEFRSFTTNIITIYYLDPVNTIYYTLTDSPPSFPYDLVSSLNDVMRDPDYSEDLEWLDIQEAFIKIELLIYQNGKTRVMGIEAPGPDVKDLNELKEYFELIFSQLPDFIPGKCKGINVNYKVDLYYKFNKEGIID